LLERFGWERVIDTPISEAPSSARLRHELPRPAPHLRDAVHRLHRLLLQPTHQFRRQRPLSLERACAHRRRGPSGGGVHGGPFHSATRRCIRAHAGLKVIYPSTPYDAKGLLKAAVRDNNPVLFFEHKFLYRRIKEELPTEDYTVPIGRPPSAARAATSLSFHTPP